MAVGAQVRLQIRDGSTILRDRRGQRRRRSGDLIGIADVGKSSAGRDEGALIALQAGPLVADFGFKAEHAEIIADDAVDIIAIVVIDSGRARRGAAREAEIDILDDRGAAFDAHIPRLIARQRRRSDRSGGQRHRNGKLPHRNPLSWCHSDSENSLSGTLFRRKSAIHQTVAYTPQPWRIYAFDAAESLRIPRNRSGHAPPAAPESGRSQPLLRRPPWRRLSGLPPPRPARRQPARHRPISVSPAPRQRPIRRRP